jgi:glutathione S-transferase
MQHVARRKVILHRCRYTWIRSEFDACRIVQNALDEAHVPYEVKKADRWRRKRDDIFAMSGQRFVPMIEFSDGSVYRAESKVMGKVIKRHKLYDSSGRAAATAEEEEILRVKRIRRWPWQKPATKQKAA